MRAALGSQRQTRPSVTGHPTSRRVFGNLICLIISRGTLPAQRSSSNISTLSSVKTATFSKMLSLVTVTSQKDKTAAVISPCCLGFTLILIKTTAGAEHQDGKYSLFLTEECKYHLGLDLKPKNNALKMFLTSHLRLLLMCFDLWMNM